MASTIKPKRSAVAGNVPTTAQISQYEIAMNTADKKIFTSDGTNIIQIASGELNGLSDVLLTVPLNGQGLSYNSVLGKWVNSNSGSGDVVGPTGATDNSLVRFDGTTGKLIQSTVALLDDDGKLTNVTIDSITNRIGADHIHFKIKATQSLVPGDVVKSIGFNAGENAYEVAKVSSATDVAIGLCHDTLSVGQFGAVVNTGLLEGFDTSAFTENTILYPNTSGGLTATKPTSGTYQAIAYVLRSHAINGAVLIEASEPKYVQTSNATPNTAVIRDESGNFNAGIISAALLGNASTASKLATPRNIALAGDVTGSVNFDGSGNVSITTTIAPNSVALGTDTTGNYVASLVAGTGISVGTAGEGATPTITNTAPNVTTDISITHNTSTVVVNSSDGADGTINAATTSLAGVMSAADKTKLDGIASGATANTGTVTSVSGTGSYGGLTLSGTVTSSGSLTLGGTPTGTWPISVSGNAATATNADTLDGIDSTAFTQSGDGYSGDFNASFWTTASRLTSISSSANSPFGNAWYTVYNSRHRGGTGDGVNYGSQIAIGMTNYTNRIAFRNQSSGTWANWTELLSTANYNSYSPTLTGTGASGTWSINVTGNAATATSTDNIDGRTYLNIDSGNAIAQDSYQYNGGGYVNGVSLFGQTDGAMHSAAYSTSWVHQIYGDFRTGQIAIRGKNSGTWQPWRVVLDSSNWSSYVSAGISTINYNNNSNGSYQMLWGSGNAIYGTAGIYCNPSTNIVYASQLQATSDERVKTNWRSLDKDYVEKLSQVKSGVYDRTDIELTQAGSSAQDWQKLLPEVVSEDENGILSLAYSNAALVSVVELAKRVVDQDKRIKELEVMISKLIERE